MQIINPSYQRMLLPSCLQDAIDYLEYLIKFYNSVIVELGEVRFSDEFDVEMSTYVQMIFKKAKMFRKMLDGFSFEYGQIVINNIVDHTVLFSIVRSMFEQLCAFELVYVLPNTEDKRLILKNAYIASGLLNRRKLLQNNEQIDEIYVQN